MKLEYTLDFTNIQDLSYFYVSICYNIRRTAKEFAECSHFHSLAYSTLELLCPFREKFLQYLYKSDRIDLLTYEELLNNSYAFICGKTDDLITLVGILK